MKEVTQAQCNYIAHKLNSSLPFSQTFRRSRSVNVLSSGSITNG